MTKHDERPSDETKSTADDDGRKSYERPRFEKKRSLTRVTLFSTTATGMIH